MNNGLVFFLTKWNSSLEQVGKVKQKSKLNKQFSHELMESGNSRFDLLSSRILCNNYPFRDWIDTSNGTQKLATTAWLDREDTLKHFPRIHRPPPHTRLYAHKFIATIGSVGVFCTDDPLQLSETVCLGSLLSKSLGWTGTVTPSAWFLGQHPTTDNPARLWGIKELGSEFFHPPYSSDFSPVDYHFFKPFGNFFFFFAEKMLLWPAGCRKCLPRVSWLLKPGFSW